MLSLKKIPLKKGEIVKTGTPNVILLIDLEHIAAMVRIVAIGQTGVQDGILSEKRNGPMSPLFMAFILSVSCLLKTLSGILMCVDKCNRYSVGIAYVRINRYCKPYASSGWKYAALLGTCISKGKRENPIETAFAVIAAIEIR